MKEKLTRNIGLKILSIILAAIIWLVITNIDDPVTPKTFRDIEVRVLNENFLDSLDQRYDIESGDRIDFTVTGKRSIIDNLSETDFNVTADLSKVSIADVVYIDIRPKRFIDDIDITEGKYQMMKISREELLSKSFAVKVLEIGEEAEGYYIADKTASPNMITVSGPKSRVERIKEVVVEVDVNRTRNSFQTTASPKAFDQEGIEVDSSKLEFSESELSIDIGVLKKKTVNVIITASGEPAPGYKRTSVEYVPKTIEIAGDVNSEVFKNFTYLSITEYVTGATENIEKEIDLQEQLPEGIILVGEDTKATINIGIEKLEYRDVTIFPGDLELKNKPDYLRVLFNSNSAMSVEVMGLRDDIIGVNKQSVNPYIDLYGLSIGTYSLEVQARPDDGLEMTKNPEISVTLQP